MTIIIRNGILILVLAWWSAGCTGLRKAESASTDPVMALIEATADLAATGVSRLPADYIWASLRDRYEDAQVEAAFTEALARRTEASQRQLLRALELKFIHDPKTSGLDILGPELS